jgi:hypothetical protein
MKTFLVLYMAPVAEMDKMMKDSTPEDMKAGMEEWRQWLKNHPEITDEGGGLGKNKRVTKDGITDARNDVGAYSFVEAESADAAAAVFKDSPHFQLPGAYIEVMECVKMD